MWNYRFGEEAMVNFRDSISGVVRRQNKWGVYIDLNSENDIGDHEEIILAFGYWSGSLPAGTKVLCSIKRPAKENKDMLVSVDSVFYQDDMEIVA